MNFFLLFLKLRFKLLKNNLFTSIKESKFKVIVIVLLMLLIWLGLFFAFYKGFTEIERYFEESKLSTEELIEQLMKRLLSMFFFALFIMLIFSNAIISYTSLYKTKETEYLVSNPVGFEEIFLHKLIECIIYSSWAFIFFGIPLIVSYGTVMNANWAFFIWSFALFLTFIFIPASIGAFLTMLIVLLIPRGSYRIIKFFALIIFFVAILFVLNLYKHGIRVSSLEFFSGLLTHTEFSQSMLLPSFWVTEGIISFSKSFENGIFYLLLVLSNSLMLIMLTTVMSTKLYRVTLEIVNSHGEKKRKIASQIYELLIPRFVFGKENEQLRQILIKDLKTFVREPAQWTQFFLFIALLVVYFSNLRNLGYHEKQYIWKVAVTLLNFGATSFTMTTFTNRFIYPQFSLETRRMWLIGMAPMMRRTILIGKFIFSFLFLLIISEALMILSCLMLDVEREILMSQIFAVLCVALSLSGLSAGLGAIYPTLKEDNPSKIIAGYGGTLSLVLSLFLVTSILLLLAFSLNNNPIALLGIFLISILSFIIPMAIASHKIEKLEF